MRGARLALTTFAIAFVAAAPAPAADPGPEWQLNSRTEDDQDYLDAASLPGGGFVAAWISHNHPAYGGEDVVVMRRFDAAGTPLGGEERVDQNGASNDTLSVSSAPDGRFVVAWTNYETIPSTEVRARVYDAEGSPGSSELAVNTTTAGSQEGPDVAMAPDGSFVVVWMTGDGPVVGRRYGAGGVPASGELPVGPGSTDDTDPAVAVRDDGSFVVTWTDYTPFPNWNVLARTFTAADVGGTAFDVAPGNTQGQGLSDVAIASDGSFVIGWGDDGADDLHLRRYAADGTPQGAPFVKANEGEPNYASDPRIDVAPDGSVIVFFQVYDGQYSVVARRFDPGLAPLGGQTTVRVGADTAPSALLGQTASYVAAYLREDADDYGVFARRYPFDALGGGTPAPPMAPPAPPAPAPAPGPTPPAAQLAAGTKPLPNLAAVAKLPSTKRCASRRKFRIRLTHPAGLRIRSATVKVNGRRVATRRGSRVTAPVDLRGLPKGRFTVDIAVVLEDGRKVTGKRRYRTCRPRRR